MATEWAVVYQPKQSRSLGVLRECVENFFGDTIRMKGIIWDQEYEVEVC